MNVFFPLLCFSPLTLPLPHEKAASESHPSGSYKPVSFFQPEFLLCFNTDMTMLSGALRACFFVVVVLFFSLLVVAVTNIFVNNSCSVKKYYCVFKLIL